MPSCVKYLLCNIIIPPVYTANNVVSNGKSERERYSWIILYVSLRVSRRDSPIVRTLKFLKDKISVLLQ